MAPLTRQKATSRQARLTSSSSSTLPENTSPASTKAFLSPLLRPHGLEHQRAAGARAGRAAAEPSSGQISCPFSRHHSIDRRIPSRRSTADGSRVPRAPCPPSRRSSCSSRSARGSSAGRGRRAAARRRPPGPPRWRPRAGACGRGPPPCRNPSRAAPRRCRRSRSSSRAARPRSSRSRRPRRSLAAASSRPSDVLSTYDMLRRASPLPTIGALPVLDHAEELALPRRLLGPVEPARPQDDRLDRAGLRARRSASSSISFFERP